MWHWTEVHDREFTILKNIVAQSPVLTYYDCKKPLTLSVDASKSGIGCTLSHGTQPIAYASTTLTECQQNYAQIEKELYAIVVGCKKFHQYVYGNSVIVETDHRPLVPLFDKPLYKVPPRLQRFMMRLQAYDLKVQYKPGKELYIADTLSRAPLPDSMPDDNMEEELKIHCNLVISKTNFDDGILSEVKRNTDMDKTSKILKDYINNSWPECNKKIDPLATPYKNIKHELHVVDGVIMKLDRIVIPKGMRQQILGIIHEGHMGISRCGLFAKMSVYWPGITTNIENMVNMCETCQRFRNNKNKEPLIPHRIFGLPWFKVGMDIFEFSNQKFLLLVDYYSKYIEIALLGKKSDAETVIKNMKSIFARHGIPYEIISDNGPPFNSSKMIEFSKNWNFNLVTSSPYCPQSNGMAERAIQTIKKLLKKCQATNSDPYMALLNLRSAPNNFGYSPAQVLMSRRLRCKLPVINERLKPRTIDSKAYCKDLTNASKNCGKHNKASNINPNKPIYFKRAPDDLWYPGSILSSLSQPRSYLVSDTQGRTYRRNSKHIMQNRSQRQEVWREREANSSNDLNTSEIPLEGFELMESRDPVQVKPNNLNEGEEVRTRSGRLVKPPLRYP